MSRNAARHVVPVDVLSAQLHAARTDVPGARLPFVAIDARRSAQRTTRVPTNRRLEAQGVVGQHAMMQSGRADDALARKFDDPCRNDLSPALVACDYLEIGARQLECDRHREDCFRVKSVGAAQVRVHRHGGYLPL